MCGDGSVRGCGDRERDNVVDLDISVDLSATMCLSTVCVGLFALFCLDCALGECAYVK